MLCAIGLGKGDLAFKVFERMLLVCSHALVEEKENRSDETMSCRRSGKRCGTIIELIDDQADALAYMARE